MGFEPWIEMQPACYSGGHYQAAYRLPADLSRIEAVMRDRKAFRLRLLSFDRESQSPPSKPDDPLPRYHRLLLEVTRTSPAAIPHLTFSVIRLGSKYGAANRWHERLPVEDIPLGRPVTRECWAFDAYNVPFQEIAIDTAFDLYSPARTAFTEFAGLFDFPAATKGKNKRK